MKKMSNYLEANIPSLEMYIDDILEIIKEFENSTQDMSLFFVSKFQISSSAPT